MLPVNDRLFPSAYYVSLRQMRPYKILLVLVLVIGSTFACKKGNREKPSDNIVMQGHVDSIMEGKFNTFYELDSLASMNHVYALGAMDSLKGEIQIFDDEAFHSIADGDSIVVGSTNISRASLLVYAEVNDWVTYNLPVSVANMEALVGYLQYDEQFEELRGDDPFVFLLEGQAEQLDWHVVVKSIPETRHGSVQGTLEEVDVEIFGIYSKEHEGTITHSGIPVHMHFKTADGMLAGHVDHLELGPEMTLRLPKSK